MICEKEKYDNNMNSLPIVCMGVSISRLYNIKLTQEDVSYIFSDEKSRHGL